MNRKRIFNFGDRTHPTVLAATLPTSERLCVDKIARNCRLEKTGMRPKCRVFYMRRNQVATARGSNRTQVPTRNEGILPAAACLKIVTSETQRKPASSLAVIARPIFSIFSARDTTDHQVLTLVGVLRFVLQRRCSPASHSKSLPMSRQGHLRPLPPEDRSTTSPLCSRAGVRPGVSLPD